MGTDAISPLRQRMIEDMSARQLTPPTQKGHIRACKRFAAFLKRSPDTATAEDIRCFQLHLTESGANICNRNRTMTGCAFKCRLRKSLIVRKSGGSSATIITKSFRSRQALAIRRDE